MVGIPKDGTLDFAKTPNGDALIDLLATLGYKDHSLEAGENAQKTMNETTQNETPKNPCPLARYRILAIATIFPAFFFLFYVILPFWVISPMPDITTTKRQCNLQISCYKPLKHNPQVMPTPMSRGAGKIESFQLGSGTSLQSQESKKGHNTGLLLRNLYTVAILGKPYYLLHIPIMVT